MLSSFRACVWRQCIDRAPRFMDRSSCRRGQPVLLARLCMPPESDNRWTQWQKSWPSYGCVPHCLSRHCRVTCHAKRNVSVDTFNGVTIGQSRRKFAFMSYNSSSNKFVICECNICWTAAIIKLKCCTNKHRSLDKSFCVLRFCKRIRTYVRALS